MKTNLLITAFLMWACFATGQVLKVQVGISGSSLNWKILNGAVKIYDQKLTGHSIFIGLDYLHKKHFNLSGNIGTIRKGGVSDDIFFTDPYGMPQIGKKQRAALDYLSLNTTLDFKYPINKKIFPFVSFGPRVDYLIANSDHFSSLKELNELNKLSYGVNIGTGIKYQFSGIELGIRGDYLLNFDNIADYNTASSRQQIKDHTFLLNLTLGFKLK